MGNLACRAGMRAVSQSIRTTPGFKEGRLLPKTMQIELDGYETALLEELDSLSELIRYCGPRQLVRRAELVDQKNRAADRLVARLVQKLPKEDWAQLRLKLEPEGA